MSFPPYPLLATGYPLLAFGSSLLSVKYPLPNDGRIYTYAKLRGAQKTCSTSELVGQQPKIDPTGVKLRSWPSICYRPSELLPPMKTRLLLAALATTAAAFAAPVNAPETSSTLPLLAVGVVALGFLARRLRK